MPRTLGDAFVRVRADKTYLARDITDGVRSASSGLSSAGGTSGEAFSKGFQETSTTRISSGLKKAAGAAAALFASREVWQGAKALVDRASDLSETGNKIDVVFGKASTRMQRFARGTVDSLGQTQQAALDAASTFGVFGKAAGLTDRENAKFSKSLTTLSSDLASFYNTSPDEAVQALGAALRGESEPIRKYGVLLDEATLKNRAMKLGLIETTKNALTPQQKVLAAQAEIMEQTKVAQGDFARTSGGLANQQRILSAQGETLKTIFGKGLMPVFSAGAKVLTKDVMPPLIGMADTWIPRITSRVKTMIREADIGELFGRAKTSLKGISWDKISGSLSGIGDSTGKIGDALGKADLEKFGSAFGQGTVDTLNLASVVVGFLADHIDLLAKAMPYLAAGFVLVKTAQAAGNAAMSVSIPLRVAELAVSRQQTAAMRAHSAALKGSTVAMGTNNAVTATSTKLTMRDRIAKVAHTVSTKVATVATKAWTIAQKALNMVLRMNPIGLVITALVALGAGLVVAYKKSETFRRIVNGAWDKIKDGVSFVWNRVLKPIFTAYAGYITKVLIPAVQWLWSKGVKPVFGWIGDKISTVWNRGIKPTFSALREGVDRVRAGFKTAVDKIGDIWDGLKEAAARPVRFVVDTVYNNGIRKVINAIPGVGDLPALRFNGGGVMPGYTPGRDVHRFISPTGGRLDLSGGEAFMRPEWTQLVGGKQAVTALNAAARRGRGALGAAMRGIAERTLHGRHQRFFLGGVAPATGYANQHTSGYPWAAWSGDINVPGSGDHGNPVRAWKAGYVAAVNRWSTSYGNHIRVNHPGSSQSSLYAHLSSILVDPNQTVRAGQVIGRVGSTGNSSGPHLHFEVKGGLASAFSGATGSGSGEIKPGLLKKLTSLPGQVASWYQRLTAMGGWGGMIKDALAKALAGTRSWINDKIPGPGPVPSFDRGGVARGRGLMLKDITRPERVLSPQQTEAFDRLVANLSGTRRVEMVITNWETGQGYIRELSAQEHASLTGLRDQYEAATRG